MGIFTASDWPATYVLVTGWMRHDREETSVSVVKINALTVPEGTGTELEARFAARKHAVDSAPGFEGFQLLRPTGGESRYFVITTWTSEDDFQAWRNSRTPHAPAGAGSPTLTTQSELLEFEVVELAD